MEVDLVKLVADTNYATLFLDAQNVVNYIKTSILHVVDVS